MSAKSLKKGARVAHNGLDNKDGAAKTGVVVEVIGDDESGLVVGRWDGEKELVAFDRREIVHLVGGAESNFGPVILKPRHMVAMFKRPRTLIALLVTMIIAIGINVVASVSALSATTTVGVGLGLILIFVLGYVVSEIRYRKR